jgi:hypothetical protein
MSRVINIKGKVIIQNMDLALEAIKESSFKIEIKNNQFTFDEYDAYDRISESQKAQEIESIETIYLGKFNSYLEQIEEVERLKIEEEKRVLREEKANIIIKNAEKQGYKLKEEISKDNTIKLVLEKRVY